MPPRRVDVRIGDLLPALAGTSAQAQQRLDAEHLERLDALGALAGGLAPEHLALLPLPGRQVLTEAAVEAELRFGESRGSEVGVELGVELLSLGYRRRYAYSGFTASKVRLTVRQVPPATLEQEE